MIMSGITILFDMFISSFSHYLNGKEFFKETINKCSVFIIQFIFFITETNYFFYNIFYISDSSKELLKNNLLSFVQKIHSYLTLLWEDIYKENKDKIDEMMNVEK